MGSIFDENSEFIDYLKKKKGDDLQQPDVDNENLYFKATPMQGGKPKVGSQDLADKQVVHEDHTELHIQESNPKETFTLNLKHVELKDKEENIKSDPIVETIAQAEEQEDTQAAPTYKKLQNLSPKNNTGILGFLWRQTKFIATTAAIFFVFFFALNWSAYSQIISNKYLQLSGELDNSPLQSFVQTSNEDTTENNVAKTPSIKVSNSPFAVNHFSIPKIQIQVVPPGARIIIPRINKNVPIINVADDKLVARDWAALESDIQDSLKDGVVHYPGTPWPDQTGNIVLTGHSSYYPWDPGRFKDVFALLHNVTEGDEIVMFYKQKQYTYKITDIQIVLPSEVNVLGDSGDDRLTLITCTPVGTNLKRLIVTAKPV